MANPFPFVANTVLTAAQLNGIGEQTSFTPSIVGLTLGNGTKTGVYVQINKLIWFKVRVVFGTTTSITANIDLTLPVAPAAYTTLYGMNINGFYLDNSATGIFAGMSLNVAGTTVRMGAILASGSYASFADLTSSAPFTWATSDTLEIFGTYEVA